MIRVVGLRTAFKLGLLPLAPSMSKTFQRPLQTIPRRMFLTQKPRDSSRDFSPIENGDNEDEKPARSWFRIYLVTMVGLIFGISYFYSQKLEEYKLHRSRIKLLQSWIKNKLKRKKIAADQEAEITSEQVDQYLEEESRKKSKKENWNEITAETINSHFGKEVVVAMNKPERIGYVHTKLEDPNAKVSVSPPAKVFYIVSVKLLGAIYPTSINQLKEILKYLNEIKVDWMFYDESTDEQLILQKTTPFKHNSKLILVNTKNLHHTVSSVEIPTGQITDYGRHRSHSSANNRHMRSQW
jgi:hypothetical protein